MPGPSSSTVTVSQRWSRWPVIEIDGAWRAAFETRMARQRLNAAGRTVTIGWPWKFTLDLWPLRSASVLSSSRKRAHVGRRRLLARIPAREGEIGLQHAAHLVDVLLHRVDLGTVADERELELEAGEDGAQVVRDSRQHGGALLQRALDAALHLDEGERGATNLARAARAEVGHFAALAEAF